MSLLVAFLIGFPALLGLALLGARAAWLRAALVVVGAAAVAAAAVAAAASFGDGPMRFFGLPGGLEPGAVPFVLELVLGVALAAFALAHRRWLPLGLALAQVALTLWLELGLHPAEPRPDRLFSFDRLTLVMVLVVGLIGPLIAVHSLGYLRDYHRRQPRLAGRRTVFFALVFLFLGAMFGLVCANHLPLLHLFWELTTLCSFLLIGYTRTEQTLGHAFHALTLNLVGGLAFGLGLALLSSTGGDLDLARLASGPAAPALLPALGCLALAGLTKSAQLPFSSWLLGAMYAPTPTSALLHSSTMVKAGVFLLLRLAPATAGSPVADGLALVGLLTFLVAALVATTETNVKKVLAYSTLSNLGLVVACAGVATAEALWVGMLVIVFHAAAKSLLFLVVGSLENRLYTKDLEAWDHLLARFPRASLLALVGVAGMFLAPFGVVLAKWSAIRAFLEVPGWRGAVFLLAMAYGSACTIYFWGKLLLKVLALRQVSAEERAVEGRIPVSEWFAEAGHAALVLALTLGVGALSSRVASPWAVEALGQAPRELLHVPPATVALLALLVLGLPALGWWGTRAHAYDLGDIYVGGRTADAAHRVVGAWGATAPVSLRNYYLAGLVSGPRAFRLGTAVGAALLLLTLVREVLP